MRADQLVGLLAEAEQRLLQGDAEGAGNLIQQAAQMDPGSPRVMLSSHSL
jgi:uncharacterized protein HemY